RPNRLWRQKLLWQAMVNGAHPPSAGNGTPLGVRPNRLWRQKLLWQAMVNGAHPPSAGNGTPLGVRNRDHRDRGKGREDDLVLRQVESPVERSDEWCGLAGKQGKWIVI